MSDFIGMFIERLDKSNGKYLVFFVILYIKEKLAQDVSWSKILTDKI